MTPSIKLHSISFGLATAIVFTIWTQLFKLTELNNFYKILIGGLSHSECIELLHRLLFI